MFDVDAESFNFQVINVGSQPCVFFWASSLSISKKEGEIELPHYKTWFSAFIQQLYHMSDKVQFFQFSHYLFW